MKTFFSAVAIVFFTLTSAFAAHNPPFRQVKGDKFDSKGNALFYYQTFNGEKESGKFYLADPNKPFQKILYLTIPNFEANHMHPAEFHNGNLYVLLMIGKYPNWKREFWKYGKDKKGIKLLEGQFGGDWGVSNDEKYIVVDESNQDRNQTEIRFDLLDAQVKLLKTFGTHELGIAKENDPDFGEFNFVQWSDHYFWLCDGEADEDDIKHFFLVDADSSKVIKYDITNAFFNYHQGFNVKTLQVLYCDYPGFQDSEDDERFRKSMTPVHLYLYNLQDQTQKLIDASNSKRFNEEWIDNNEIEYDNPRGDGRIRKKIGVLN